MSDTPLTPDQIAPTWPIARGKTPADWAGPSVDELIALGNLCYKAAYRWGMDPTGTETTGRFTTPEWAIQCHQAAAAYFEAARLVDMEPLPGPAGPPGPPGADSVVPGPTAVSADANNLSRLGSDRLIYTGSDPAKLNRIGTKTNDNAPAGEIGEFIAAQLMQANALALTTNVDAVLITLPLTAGDWDVWGSVAFQMAGANNVTIRGWINPTGAISPSMDQMGGQFVLPINSNVPLASLPVTPMRVSLAAAGNVRLGVNATFGSASTFTAFGKIMARRAR